MAATTPSSSTILSTPRRQQMLLWISGAVLVIGICVFVGVFFFRGTAQPAVSDIGSNQRTFTNPLSPGAYPHVKPAASALRNARTFLETAVARKNLDASYDIVGPMLKGGTSRAQWRTGNIPVTYFPAANLKTAKFNVKVSNKKVLFMTVGLEAGKHTNVIKGLKSLGFQLEVDRIGDKWLVNYFMPDNPGGVPANPYQN
jgi:hypothetical protein